MITDKGALLLIGAGTSLQFGLPSGERLFEEILIQLGIELREPKTPTIINKIQRACVYNEFYFVPGGKKLAILPAIAHESKFDAHKTIEIARSVYARMNNQTSETIDDFIFQNPDISLAVKLCVATCIFNSLYKWDNSASTFRLSNLESRQLKVGGNVERNWVHLLINIVREGVRNGATSPENKVKIVTFNYDMVLEYILDGQFSNVSNTIIPDDSSWQDYIEVAHVHGKFNGMVPTIQKPYALISKWAYSFVVIHQTDGLEKIQDERETAVQLVLEARKYFASGFSFSASNVELIKLVAPNSRGSIDIHYANYDGNVGLRTALDRLKTSQAYDSVRQKWIPFNVRVHPTDGTPEKPMSAVDWFRAGIPGRPPS